MKSLLLLVLMLVIWSCSSSPEHLIPFLEGYWEIDQVTLPDGGKKVYKYNDTVEYIKISDSLNGVRTKLRPNMNGGFQTSEAIETFQIKIENDSLNIYYKTPFAEWKETILSASEKQLLVINQAKVRYLYKRYQSVDHSHERTP